MAFCDQCGATLSEGARFCASCGTAVNAASYAASMPSRSTVDSVTGPGPTRPDPSSPGTPYPASATRSLPHNPATAGAPIEAPRGGIGGLVLPIMVVIAVLLIGYLLFTGRKTEQAAAVASSETAARSDPSAASSAPKSFGGNSDDVAAALNTPAVEEATDAAMAALERARASGARLEAANTATSAAALDSAFFSDPRGAALRYPGPVRVSGVIASMVMPGRTPSLAMEGRSRFNSMVVNFPEGYNDRLAPLYKGRFITVACDSVGTVGGTTFLRGCLLA